MLFRALRDAYANSDGFLNVIHLYRELAKFTEKSNFPINIDPYLEQFRKNPHDCIEDYFLTRHCGLYWHYYGNKQTYHDTLYSFILVKGTESTAVLGFNLDKSNVHVGQIQGVKKTVHQIKWERMLLNITVDWARKYNFKSVRVRPAEKNPWYESKSLDEEGKKRFKMHYDVTAQRSGFKYDDQLGLYVLDL